MFVLCSSRRDTQEMATSTGLWDILNPTAASTHVPLGHAHHGTLNSVARMFPWMRLCTSGMTAPDCDPAPWRAAAARDTWPAVGAKY